MKAVLITGAEGGIGSALVDAFARAGYFVVGTDSKRSLRDTERFIEVDLARLATEDAVLDEFRRNLLSILNGNELEVIVNNAAVQLLGPTEDISSSDWETTLRVNITAPFRLAQALVSQMKPTRGCILNIGSVHAQATKAGFVAYATSKAALHGLTRALAVDLGARTRIVCLAPAAVGTPMLRSGFEGNPEAFAALASVHPIGRIAEPSEIARAAVALVTDPFLFATGSIFYLDGGVLSRLHDPA